MSEYKPTTVEELRACIGRRVFVAYGSLEDGDYDDAIGVLLSVDDDGDITVKNEEHNDTRYFYTTGHSGAKVSLLDGSDEP